MVSMLPLGNGKQRLSATTYRTSRIMPIFHDFWSINRTGERTTRRGHPRLAAVFSGAAMSSPTWWTYHSERQAIKSRIVRECRLDWLESTSVIALLTFNYGANHFQRSTKEKAAEIPLRLRTLNTN